MAQFIKFPLTGSQEELLIPISEIANVETVTTTSTKIELANGTKKFTITHLVPLVANSCLLYTSPSPRDRQKSRMPSSA